MFSLATIFLKGNLLFDFKLLSSGFLIPFLLIFAFFPQKPPLFPEGAEHWGGFRSVEARRFELAAEVVNLERSVVITGDHEEKLLSSWFLFFCFRLFFGCLGKRKVKGFSLFFFVCFLLFGRKEGGVEPGVVGLSFFLIRENGGWISIILHFEKTCLIRPCWEKDAGLLQVPSGFGILLRLNLDYHQTLGLLGDHFPWLSWDSDDQQVKDRHCLRKSLRSERWLSKVGDWHSNPSSSVVSIPNNTPKRQVSWWWLLSCHQLNTFGLVSQKLCNC